ARWRSVLRPKADHLGARRAAHSVQTLSDVPFVGHHPVRFFRLLPEREDVPKIVSADDFSAKTFLRTSAGQLIARRAGDGVDDPLAKLDGLGAAPPVMSSEHLLHEVGAILHHRPLWSPRPHAPKEQK